MKLYIYTLEYIYLNVESLDNGSNKKGMDLNVNVCGHGIGWPWGVRTLCSGGHHLEWGKFFPQTHPVYNLKKKHMFGGTCLGDTSNP
ncbi:hypothetical protein EUGRSUZ_F01911 [Eucalyptus grandis]|uniref:Uncharacterized protein n=2 Tax=Eucalyptus grandis TaxID=71139 RepID=A0ACC3KG69_EUCGR|nr:hypothetical protein EUGRSUZ_F01911 [Eucalyptus grandis]